MRYLLIARRNHVPLPVGKEVHLMKAALDWTEAHERDQNLECNFALLTDGGVAILNCDTHEEVRQTYMSYPLYSFYDWELIPLSDMKLALKGAIESFTHAIA